MLKSIPLLVSILVISIFLMALNQFVINVPSFDDYAATLIFLKNHYFQNTDTGSKLRSLLIPHNEHYILVSRLSAAIVYLLFGRINFAALVWYQNLYLLGIFLLLLRIIYKQGFPVYILLIPISLFLFNLSFWQVTLYYWGGIQYYAVFFFSILSLYLLHQDGSYPWLRLGMAMLAALLALLSFGNGILVLPLGFFLLLVRQTKLQLALWSLFSLACLSFFLSGFQSSFESRPPFNLLWMGRLLFTFLGSFLYVNPATKFWSYANIILCCGAGITIFYFWIRLFITGYAFQKPFLYALLSLPILTGLLIAIARFDAKAAGGIAPRYLFFSACIPIFLLLIFQDIKKIKNAVILPIIALAVIIWGLSLVNNWREIERHNTDLLRTLAQWQQDRSIPLVYYNPNPVFSDALLWAIDNQVYTCPYPTPPAQSIRLSTVSP